VLAIFLFGLFVPRTPRSAGVLGLLLSPIIYGVLFFFWKELAFLNRMAITVGLICAVLAVLTIVRPLQEPVRLPVQSKIEMHASTGAKLFGWLVIAATAALYWIFW